MKLPRERALLIDAKCYMKQISIFLAQTTVVVLHGKVKPTTSLKKRNLEKWSYDSAVSTHRGTPLSLSAHRNSIQ